MSDEFFDKYNALNGSDEPNGSEGLSPSSDTPDTAYSVDSDNVSSQTASVPETSYDDTAYSAADEKTADRYTEDTSADSSYGQADTGYEVQRYEAPRYEAPKYEAPQQSSTWQNPYYTAPQAQQNPYGAYTGRPIQSDPGYQQASASYVSGGGAQTPPSSNPANTYVDANGYYHRSFTERSTTPQHSAPQPERKKEKKSSGISKGAVAVILVLCILLSGVAGFGGSYLFSTLKSSGSDSGSYNSVSDELVIHKVSVETSTEGDKLVDKGTDEIVNDVADSVVEITTEVVQTNSFYGQYIATGAGSGVIISNDGYIVTNNHVIEDSSSITVTLRSGESYDAVLVGTDADEDVALIKINAEGLTTAVFGDSSTLEVGDKSVIIGNPLGTLGGSVTEGIVSALDRSIVIDGKTMHLMQTDAAINPGNSGGGMFNGQGELVGIVVAKSGGTAGGSTIDNIGFAIPINNVLNILGDLKQYGYVRGKAYTGMSFVDITNQMYAWYYYNSSNTGVYISSVERGSSAASAGFSAGDRVISVDGKTIDTASELNSIISEHSAGDTITFELERNGRTGTIDLTLDEYVPGNNSSSSPFGSYY